jgi:RecA-family ATPase
MSVIRPGVWEEAPRKRTVEEFKPFSPSGAWENAHAPALDWLVQGAFVKGSVAILAGDGGLGKSLLMQQLMTASWTGQNWLGMRTQKCRSLAVFCEDDIDELHRRQERINEHYGCGMRDLEGVMIESRPGRDCVLMQFKQWGGDGRETPMLAQVKHAARTHGAKIVILDTVADVFSGNEVDRNQPRTFIRALRQLALEIQGVVILTQHPSNEGMASGTGRSGSTGWHNSVRSRLYLTKPKGTDDTQTNERLLKTMKQNAGPFGGKISLTWEKGVFKLTDQTGQQDHYWQDS